MKLRNTRKRQWVQYQNRLIRMERRGHDVCMGHGQLREWSRRMNRMVSKHRALMRRDRDREIRRHVREGVLPHQQIAEIFGVPIEMLGLDGMKVVRSRVRGDDGVWRDHQFTGTINKPGITIRKPD